MSTASNKTPKRPTVSSEMVLAAAQELVGQQYFPLEQTRATKEAAAQHLASCYCPGMGGYELARELDDDHGWRIDSHMVDELEVMGHMVDEQLMAAEAKWHKEHNIQPPYPVGTMIAEGEITSIYEHSPARYLVKTHGQAPDSETGNRRLVIKFEDAKP